MKKLLLSFTFLVMCVSFVQAQFYTKLAYQNSLPVGAMGKYIGNNAHGIGLEAGLKITDTPITLGWHWAILSYGSRQTEELYVFSQGAQSFVSVNVDNYFRQSHFFVHYDLKQEGFIRPYMSLGLGRSRFETVMNIEATTSTFECPKPIEQRQPSKDKVGHYMIAAGVKFDFTRLLNLKDERNLSLIVHIQHIRGRETEFLNVRGASNPQTSGEPINIKFSSEAQPNVIYEYYAGDRYSSPVRLLTMQLGLAYVFAW